MFVVVDVKGVGYLVHTNTPTDKLLLDSEITFHTHLAVRENALDLYGFSSLDELEVFDLLITLPKIGPKTALQILTQASVDLIKEATRNDDPAHLSKLSGIGKKSAEKIVSGLRDKLEDDLEATVPTTAGTVAATTADTIDALIALGYPPTDARRAVLEVGNEHPSLTSSGEILKEALRILSR